VGVPLNDTYLFHRVIKLCGTGMPPGTAKEVILLFAHCIPKAIRLSPITGIPAFFHPAYKAPE